MSGSGALLEAAKAGDVEEVKQLLAGGADLTAMIGGMFPVVSVIAGYGHPEVFKEVLCHRHKLRTTDLIQTITLAFDSKGGAGKEIQLMLLEEKHHLPEYADGGSTAKQYFTNTNLGILQKDRKKNPWAYALKQVFFDREIDQSFVNSIMNPEESDMEKPTGDIDEKAKKPKKKWQFWK